MFAQFASYVPDRQLRPILRLHMLLYQIFDGVSSAEAR
jgi:hypothetical protein